MEKIINNLNEFYKFGHTQSYLFRKNSLMVLKEEIIKSEQEIYDALKKDLNKSSFETYVSEVAMVLQEIDYTVKHLKKWMKDKKVSSPMMNFPSKSKIKAEPYGTVLIISPWNYPFQLALIPLVGAIAAGNCCLLKPSEFAPNTTEIVEKILTKAFRNDYVSVIKGDNEVAQKLLEYRFNYIFFTGSVSVGKKVMIQAANNLTPVTLELGGKSPCIVDETANLSLAAKRIVWGKCINSGQTCVAPDYLLVHESVKDKLLKNINKAILKMYGEDPIGNEEYPRIINKKHFDRLVSYLKEGVVLAGGQYDEESLKIEPTIINEINEEANVLKDEIFGPIMPIITYKNIKEAINYVNEREKPLALYYFTSSKENEKLVLNSISFGGGCVNDTITHLINCKLPFGGVGNSGIGAYHGKYSFDTFTHYKSIVKKSNLIDMKIKYPPYEGHLKKIKKIVK